MKPNIIAIASAVLVLSAPGMPSHATTHERSAAQPQSALTDGEVLKVDRDTKKITIKHGPLTNLGMPAMTMIFQAKDPAMLESVKTGDKIRFVAERIDGAYTVTQIQPR